MRNSMDNNNVSREHKLQIIGLNYNDTISDDNLNTIYNKFLEQLSINSNQLQHKKEKTPKKMIVKNAIKDKIDKNSDKYKIVMEFLNALLKTLNKQAINDITEFKYIKRDEIIKKECENVLPGYLDRIIDIFGKYAIRYSMRTKIQHYHLSVIKYLVSHCGYNFSSNYQYKSMENKDGVSGIELHIYYSITE